MKTMMVVIVAALLAAGCQTTQVAPHSTVSQYLEEDEERIWDRVLEEEAILDSSGFVYIDPELEDYLNSVLARVAPEYPTGPLQFRVMVIKNPTLNAFAYPNGVIYIHTGLLSRLENEAQLATLLAHEMTHASHRHALKQYRDIKNKTAFLATVQAGLLSMGSVGSLAGSLGSIGVLASVQGYSRDLEREADYEGFLAVKRAGYDTAEAPKLFHHLQAWVEENDINEPFFFGSHPKLQERIDNFTELIEEQNSTGNGGVKNSEVYMAHVLPVVLLNAALDLDSGRYTSAKKGIAKYHQYRADNPQSYCLLGDVLAEEKGDDFQAHAMDNYQQAVAIDPDFGEAYRGVGLVQYKSKNCTDAVAAFQRYLELCPEAKDRSYIQYYLEQCSK